MAKMNEVGGMLYVGSAPPSEQIPEHDTEINDDQVIGSAVVAGPITIGATVTINGNMVVI
tara:strand:- start:111 stop:290 length:180 start_codon:yes stop_codon:yes gene_type:complete